MRLHVCVRVCMPARACVCASACAQAHVRARACSVFVMCRGDDRQGGRRSHPLTRSSLSWGSSCACTRLRSRPAAMATASAAPWPSPVSMPQRSPFFPRFRTASAASGRTASVTAIMPARCPSIATLQIVAPACSRESSCPRLASLLFVHGLVMEDHNVAKKVDSEEADRCEVWWDASGADNRCCRQLASMCGPVCLEV